MLNAQKVEYCGYRKDIWYGVGIEVALHDPNNLPFPIYDTSVKLQPGMQYNIALKSQKYKRNTQHLGKCINSYPMYLFPGAKGYVKQFCIFQCENELLWKHCGCLIIDLPPIVKSFAKWHGLNENETNFRCSRDQILNCTTKLQKIAFNEGVEKYCPQCKQPCEEDGFQFDITATAFPPNHLINYYSKMLNTSEKEIRDKNYIVLNVYFESSSVNVIIDSQKFDVRDLFIFIGNNVGLFLGMSFVSFFEIFDVIIKKLADLVKIVKKKKKAKKKVKKVKKKANKNKQRKLSNIRHVSVHPACQTSMV